MTDYHLVLSAPLNVAGRRAEAAAGQAPRHFLLELADALGGQIHAPDPEATASPRLIHRILRTPPSLAALADRVATKAGPEDVIFCMGEAVALPLAQALQHRRSPARLATFGHNLQRPRIRAANLLTGCLARLDRVFVFTRAAMADPARYSLYSEQTDNRFFRPDPAPDRAGRPRIVSVGLERRDYATLAEAARGLEAEFRISAFSSDARASGRAHPADTPPGWDMRFYDWPDLAALYRSADVVAIPLEPGTAYAAGITTLLEAAASRRPVVASDTGGLRDAFSDPGAVLWVPPGDPAALYHAMAALLSDPGRAAALAEAACAAVTARHSLDARVEDMAATLRDFEKNPR